MKYLPAIAFLIAATIGWNLGKSRVSVPKSTTVTAESPGTERPTRHPRKVAGPTGEAALRMAAIRASRDPSARMRATVDLANSIPLSEFAAWMDGGWFNIRGGAELTIFSNIFMERWKTEDPEGYAAWTFKKSPERAHELLSSWAETNPQRVLDFFKNHPNDTAEMRALSAVARKDPALALQRMQELLASGNLRSLSSYTGSLFNTLAEKSPAALEAALAILPGQIKIQAEAILIGKRMKDSLDVEFGKLLDHPDGLKLLDSVLDGIGSRDQSKAAIQAMILANLSGIPSAWRISISSNPYNFIGKEMAAKWITADLEGAGFTAEQAKRLRANALGNLYGEPAIALKLLPEVAMDESERKNFLSNVFNRFAYKPGEADAFIAMLTTDEDRALVQGIVSREELTEKAKPQTPADWLSSLAEAGNRPSSIYGHLSSLREWDSGKLADLNRQFKEMPDDKKRIVADMISALGHSEASPLQGEAVRYLVAHPAAAPPNASPEDTPQAQTIRLASNYIGRLANSNPTGASEWIQTLPEGDARLWAQKNLHSIWSQYDPAAANEWMSTLPAATQNKVKNLGQSSGH